MQRALPSLPPAEAGFRKGHLLPSGTGPRENDDLGREGQGREGGKGLGSEPLAPLEGCPVGCSV